MDRVTEILSQTKKLLTEIYFDLQLHFEEKYGKDALVLIHQPFDADPIHTLQFRVTVAIHKISILVASQIGIPA